MAQHSTTLLAHITQAVNKTVYA